MRTHLRPLLLLLGLDLLFFHALVLNPTGVLYSPHSDLLAEHVPAKRFLVRSYQDTGELPLWCPHLFAGSPFVHDIQVAMFYPPHLVLLLLPEEAVGPALSWLVVLHVLLAGWLMYAYACHRGLTPLSAFVAAIGFMFGGRWLMHLLGGGHYILIGLAWLPLVLLGWERVIAGRGWAWGVIAGIAYALMTLSTQPQWTFYSGLFAALWTLGARLDASDRRAALWRWLVCGVVIVLVTLGLTAIQLLPTLEAAGQSSRAGGVGAEGIARGGVSVLLYLVGPAQSDEPFNLAWEDRGGLAILWLILAVWSVLLRDGRTRYEAGVTLGLFLFAMGGALLFQWLPGFNLFRQPARMVIVATLPVAWLAARALDRLFDPEPLTEKQQSACLRWAVRIGVAATILFDGFTLRLLLEDKPITLSPYLLLLPSLLYLVPLFLLRYRPGSPGWRAGLVAILVLDLFLVVAIPPRAMRESDIFPVPDCVTYVEEHMSEPGRVLDADRIEDDKPAGTPLGSGAALAPIKGIDAVRGYSPLDVRSYREFLQMAANEARPLGALTSDYSYPVVPNVPTQNEDPNAPTENKNLIDLLNVRFRLLPDGADPKRGWKRRHVSEGTTYDFLAGGVPPPTRWAVWENQTPLPRTFVVREARPLPERAKTLATFRKADFGEVVYLDDLKESKALPGAKREARIDAYQPNCVRVDVGEGERGFLVLGDVWYPGWRAFIDGDEVDVHRANWTFRAVEVPAGKRTVEFRFEPGSYHTGRTVTFVSLAAVVLALAALMLRSGRSAAAGADRPRGPG